MVNYEKLCEAVGIKNSWYYFVRDSRRKEHMFKKKDFIDFVEKNKTKKWLFVFCQKETDIFNICFEWGKQLELIKLLMEKGCFTGYANKVSERSYVLEYALRFSQNEDFSEALAGLLLKLIEHGEIDKEEIRKVLENEY